MSKQTYTPLTTTPRGSPLLSEADAQDVKRLGELVERLRKDGISLPRALKAVGYNGKNVGGHEADEPNSDDEMQILPDDGSAKPKEIFSVDCDAYGLIIMRIVHYFDEHSFSTFPTLSVVHAIVLWCVNLALQMGVTYTLLQLAEELEKPWENVYFMKNYDMSIFEATALVSKAAYMPAGAATAEIDVRLLGRCKEAVGVPYSFYWLMIYLWMVKNFAELERTFFLFLRLLHVERKTSPDQTILSEDCSTIERLPRWLLVLMIVTVVFTKAAVACMITYAGMKFLVLQNNELTIILKALSMQFVTTIDELLLSLATTRTKAKLRQMKIKTTVTDPGKQNSLWDAGLGGMAHMAITFCITAVTINGIFGGLIGFRQACTVFHDRYGLEGVQVRSLSSYASGDFSHIFREAMVEFV